MLQTWEKILSDSITTPGELSRHLDVDEGAVRKVTSRYPMRINSYFLSLIGNGRNGLFEQAVPDSREITVEEGLEDPLGEEERSPVPGLTHKYPDRVLFLISGTCPVYCRFCNRKRKVGRASMVTGETIREGLSYIKQTKKIRDVLLSGGDPLLLPDEELHSILSALRSMPHVEIIRIGTRVPSTLPQRVTPVLAKMLKGFHPLYINTHFNHPGELTREAALACGRIADAGIPLSCQTVLLRGVNDDAAILKDLMQRLVAVRVRPYYLFQADLAKGTSHFWTPLNKGLEIMEALVGHTSGLCVPRFVIDIPGGGGKIPLVPEYVLKVGDKELLLKNYEGKTFRYPIVER